MFDAEINSGFTNGGDINISNHFTEITLLHESSNGYTHAYKAKRYGQWHVLKCLTPEAAEQVQYQTLLEKEFRIAYPLSHPNIVRTLGLEDVPGIGICIIQEYIDGEPISCITREQAAELCDAVAYIHKAGVIHRDIKPDNVMVRRDNRHIVLIDFGLADKVDFSVLKGGAGTSQFAAPEQWTGDISPAVDIYGIGGVLARNKKLRRFADKCRRENPQKRYRSVVELEKRIARKFPWSILCICILFVLLGNLVVFIFQYRSQADKQAEIQMQQIEELQSNHAANIDAMIRKNDSLRNRLIIIETQEKQMNEDLERMRNAYIRSQHESNSFYNSYGRDNSADSQRY